MTSLPWELSQIGELARAKHERRRTRRLSAKRIRGRLIEHLDRPCPYCGIAMNDFNGRNDWRAGRVKPISAFKALRASETTSLSRGGPE